MRRPTGALIAAVALGLAAVLLASGCGDDGASGEESLRIGYAFGSDAGDVGDMLAYERLRADGVAVTVSDAGGSENAVAALRRGSIDIAGMSQASLAQAVAQGAELVAILGQNMVSESQLVARGVAGAAALEGKKVAVGSGPSGPATVAVAEESAGLPEGSIVQRVLPESSARAVALSNGRVAAAVLDGSDVIRLQQELPDLRVIARLADFERLLAPVVFVVRRDALERSPELMQRFTTSILGASETLNGDAGRDEFIRIALEGPLEGDSAELAGSIYDYYRAAGLWPKASEPLTEEQYETTMEFLRTSGQLDVNVPFEDVWDLRYWKSS